MRAAISLPIVILVAIVIGVAVLLVGLFSLGSVPTIIGTQTAQGFLQQCITGYKLAGHCTSGEETGTYPDFDCAVSKEFSSTGKMDISELASRANTDIKTACGV